jgi:hypothetical protein
MGTMTVSAEGLLWFLREALLWEVQSPDQVGLSMTKFSFDIKNEMPKMPV